MHHDNVILLLWHYSRHCYTTVVSSTMQGIRWYEGYDCYPSRRRVYQLVCGGMIAGVAVVVYGLFETHSNYRYVHSVWHVCTALCTTLLLPTRPQYSDGEYNQPALVCTQLTKSGYQNVSRTLFLCYDNVSR